MADGDTEKRPQEETEEEVDDPDDYKGDPIPGGPSDPHAEDVSVIRKDDGGGRR